MGPLTVWAWVAVGVSIPIVGLVEDSTGKPKPGASVWLGDTFRNESGIELLGATIADPEGKFRLDRDEKVTGRGGFWSPTLWVYSPGQRVGFIEFKRKVPAPDEPVRLVVEPTSGTPVRVLMPDGKPASGARIRLTQAHFRAPRPPSSLFDRLAVTTDLEGRATLDGVRPEDVAALDVTVAGYVTQRHAMTQPSPDPKVVAIRPVGRLVIRVVADDPNAVQGWRITTDTTPDEAERYASSTSWVQTTTDPLGLAEPRPLAAGRITWKFQPPANSPYLAEDPPGVVVRANEQTDVRISLKKATRVVGTIREASGGRPVPGVKVITRFLGASLTTDDPTTDADGRFVFKTLPGKTNYRIETVPKSYFATPGAAFATDFTVASGQADYTLPPMELRRAVSIRGRVIDDLGRGIPGLDVIGYWKSPEFPNQRPMVRDLSNGAGEFTLGGIAPNAQVEVSTSIPLRAESNIETVLATDPPGNEASVLLRLRYLPTYAVGGRVLSPDGRPVANARIGLELRKADQNIGTGSDFRFDSVLEIKTNDDGAFQTPSELPVGTEYRVKAEAFGFSASLSRWANPAATKPVEVRLLSLARPRSVGGRVVDSMGEAVPGAEVFQSGDGPVATRSLADALGRFEVAGIADGPAFLFARAPGFRLNGRVVEAADRSVELVVTRSDQPPRRLVTSPPQGGPEDREIALKFLDAAWKQHLNGGRGYFKEPSVLETIAALDPDRISAMIENQVIVANPKLIAALVANRVEDDPQGAVTLLDDLSPPATSAQSLLDVFEMWRTAKPLEFSRDLLERARRQTDKVTDQPARLNLLIALANAWYDLGVVDQGGAIGREADALLDKKQGPGNDFLLGKVAEVLAPVDLPTALIRLEAVTNANSADPVRVKIAERIAATDPAEAKRLLGQISMQYLHFTADRSVCVRMASGGHLAEARALAESSRLDPTTQAILTAIAASHLDPSRSDQARALLAESFDRLKRLAGSRQASAQPNQIGPLVAMAQLISVAARVDPDRATDYFWETLAARHPRPFGLEQRPVTSQTLQHYLDLSALAVLIAPFDRKAAGAVFSPVADRIPSFDDETWGLHNEAQALFRTATAFDARSARTMWNALPEDPAQPKDTGPNGIRRNRPQPKTDSQLEIARSLAVPPRLRARNALLMLANPGWIDELGH